MKFLERLKALSIFKKPVFLGVYGAVCVLFGVWQYFAIDEHWFFFITAPVMGLVYYGMLSLMRMLYVNSMTCSHKSTPTLLTAVFTPIALVCAIKIFDPMGIMTANISWFAFVPLGLIFVLWGVSSVVRDLTLFDKAKLYQTGVAFFGLSVCMFGVINGIIGWSIPSISIPAAGAVIAMVLILLQYLSDKNNTKYCDSAETLTPYFDKYLNKVFKKLGANDFNVELREQLLYKLTATAEAMAKENRYTLAEIYYAAVDGLGDFSALTKERLPNRIEKITKIKFKWVAVVFTVVLFINFMIVGSSSFVFDKRDEFSCVFLALTVAAGVIVLLIARIVVGIKNKDLEYFFTAPGVLIFIASLIASLMVDLERKNAEIENTIIMAGVISLVTMIIVDAAVTIVLKKRKKQ